MMNTLEQQLHHGEITTLEYVRSRYSSAYADYCNSKGIQQNEQSAQSFLEWSLNQEEQAHTEYLD